MRAFWIFLWLRARELRRSPASLSLYFALPVGLLLLLGGLFADGHPFERRDVGVLGADAALSLALGELPGLRLHEEQDLSTARRKLDGRARAGLVLGGASPRVIVGEREALWGHGLAAALPGARVEVVALPRLGYVHFLVPGTLALAALFGGLFGMGYNLLRYRQGMFLQKLATTPLRRSVFVGAQIVARALLVLAQLGALLGASWLLLGLPLGWEGALAALLIALLGLLVFCGIGFAAACVITSEVAFLDALNALLTPLVLLSGVFFATDTLPWPLEEIARRLPSAQLVELLRAALLFGEGLGALARPEMAWLCGWAGLGFAAGLRFFDWKR